MNIEPFENRRAIEKILHSLTRKYKSIVVVVEKSKDLSTMAVDSLLGSLQSHQLRMKQSESSPTEQAFQTQVSFRKVLEVEEEEVPLVEEKEIMVEEINGMRNTMNRVF